MEARSVAFINDALSALRRKRKILMWFYEILTFVGELEFNKVSSLKLTGNFLQIDTM